MLQFFTGSKDTVMVARKPARFGVVPAEELSAGQILDLAPGLQALVGEEVTRREFNDAAGPPMASAGDFPGMRFYSVMLVGREPVMKTAKVKAATVAVAPVAVRSSHAGHATRSAAPIVGVTATVNSLIALKPVA